MKISLRQRAQRGFTLVSVLLGSLIVAVILGSIIYPLLRDMALADRGKALSTAVAPFHGALFAYSLAHRVSLTNNGTIAGVVTAQAPTCTELRALMPALLDYKCSIPEGGGTPVFTVTPIPTGCTGTACDLAYTVTPLPIGRDVDGSAIVQAAVDHFGSEAGQSLVGFGAVIRGRTWSRPNPNGDAPRTFGTYATVGTSMFSQFVTINDIRNPNFLGNVTIAQQLSVTGTITSVTGVGSGDATCNYTELTSTGRIFARSAACIDRVVADGNTGTIETRSASGSVTTRIGEGVYVFNNTINTAGINPDGGVFGTSATFAGLANLQGGATISGAATLATVEVAGAACQVGQVGRQADGMLLACVGNIWRIVGLSRVARGDPCVDGVALDQAAPTNTLFCRGGVYVSLNSALGRIAWLDSLVVLDGSVVPAPACETGSAPVVQVVPSQFQSPAAGGTARYAANGSGPWTISITGAGAGEAIAWRGCQYAIL